MNALLSKDAPTAKGHTKREAAQDEVDPFEKMLERSGCAELHYALQVGLFELCFVISGW